MFVNYGDHNFFEYGMLVDNRDSDIGVYYILCCFPYDDLEADGNEVFQFADCMVDIQDEWIVQEFIEEYGDCKKSDDPLMYAVNCVEYYGPQEFNGGEMVQYTRQEICEILKHKCVVSDNLDIIW